MSAVQRLRAWAAESAARKVSFRRDGSNETYIINAMSEGSANFNVDSGGWQPIEAAASKVIGILEALGEDVPTK